ncbi:MAG TPA: chorismate-binding protein [Bacteroidales bacterium]|jgi:isochorismate synthase|nr:chorismate-binding protein [Bacteroidales bacterium]|tara:strand:+ start:48 stop:1151 length:1104 start_codon:yes stop_codon:yes gene_type:complete
MINSILEIPQMLIKKGLPFAIYCLPSKKKFNLIFQKDVSLHEIDILDIEQTNGFVIANFESAKTGLVNIIKPDYVLSEDENITEIVGFLDTLPDIGNFYFENNYCISKADYLDRADYLINQLKDGYLKKVVFSRVIHKKLKEELKLNQLLSMLKEKYNNAFINLFHLPGIGTWCGATPETLFKKVDNYVITDAMAGTQLLDEDSENITWTNKEKEEQHLVSLFIESNLSELGIHDFDKVGPINVSAGHIAHIQTQFKIPFSSLNEKEGKFIASLHPTPAVCGLPKAEAYLMIHKAEQHQRRYYTGFLGPWKLANQSQLFVNLRCAELDTNKINIYVGGGLTASSSNKDEYKETVYKSKTLLSIVENL